MTKTPWLTVTTSAMVFALMAPSIAQEQTNTTQEGPTWLAACSNQTDPETLTCTMSQTLTVSESGQRLLSVTVQPSDQEPSILLTMPHGLSFSEGVGFATDDGAEERFDFTTADTAGTYARVPLTGDRLAALRAANTLRLNVIGVGGREVNFEVSLAGFSRTYDLLP